MLGGCQTGDSSSASVGNSTELKQMFHEYWEERLQLFPLEATAIGDNRYNNQMTITISESFREKSKAFYEKFLQKSKAFKSSLNDQDALSKEIFEYEMESHLKEFNFPSHLMPINQFWSFTLEFPQLGSGDANQPFKTVKDYDNFLQRMAIFPNWIDTAIANMKKGIQQGIVLPKVLAAKIIPQIKGVLTIDPTKNIFYNPIKHFPTDFNSDDKKRLIQNFTTTTLSADSIYNLGLKEVARIQSEMEKVKESVGFKGSLPEFFTHINSDPQFYPFNTPKEVLDSFWAIHKIEEKYLDKFFESKPKTKFEIKQTEAYRAASASAEYNAGSEDGTRPGIFYVPILNPKKFNIVGMETLFLHEAIPGHHYQISLQQENKTLPQFRKFLGYSAYAEGWALYTETLGKDLGLYTNPYQYLGHLSDAMHRAIRLVVDAGMHTKGMTREEAIKYMTEHERITEEEAVAEIERYMAIPGQALSYKIGQLSISAMKAKYMEKMGAKFNLAAFHTQILNGGNMPLQLLEKKLADWAKTY